MNRTEKKPDEEIAFTTKDHKEAAIEADEADSTRNSTDSSSQHHSDDRANNRANGKETFLNKQYEKICNFIQINGYLEKSQLRQIFHSK